MPKLFIPKREILPKEVIKMETAMFFSAKYVDFQANIREGY